MTQFRFHCGMLADSMATVINVHDIFELSASLETAGLGPGAIAVKAYCFDQRIGWDTHIVTVDGNAVGFTDGPLQAGAA